MQRFVDSGSGRAGGNPQFKRRSQFATVIGCVVVAAWVSFFVLPYMDESSVPVDASRQGGAPLVGVPQRPAAVVQQAPHVVVTTAAHHNDDGDAAAGPDSHDTDAPQDEHDEAVPARARRGRQADVGGRGAGSASAGELPVLEPWGYNKDRNVARWNAISKSIQSDVVAGRVPAEFTVVDYGADMGFFSISTAKAFPESFVMAVELGGKGGTLWNKTKIDVHETQQDKIKEHHIAPSHINLCQTMVLPEFFHTLRSRRQSHTYQYVLSVFHWFPMETRAEFERVVVDLFANARTTFIELPTIGDNSKLIKKQEGYKKWSKWYDGRRDVAVILRAAIEAQGMKANVRLVASLPWVKWERIVYRVDVLGGAEIGGGDGDHGADADPFAQFSFSCDAHRTVYGCKRRSLYQRCGESDSS